MPAGTTLTVKQRCFVKHYLETGNGTAAAMAAYAVADRNTARSIGTENLRKPAVQEAVAELLDAGGLSDEKLLAIHAHYLGLCTSSDPRLKAPD
jgi:phage terminase small subunit